MKKNQIKINKNYQVTKKYTWILLSKLIIFILKKTQEK